MPKSAGELTFVHAAFGSSALATAIGFLVMTTGATSSGAIVIGFVGYLHEVVAVPSTIATIGVVVLLAAIVAWGIGESVKLAAVITMVEIGGLLLIIGAGTTKGADVAAVLPEVVSLAAWSQAAAILSGAVLAFLAFVGFEGIVNWPRRRKIRCAPCRVRRSSRWWWFSGLYFMVTLIAVALVPLDRLGGSDTPLTLRSSDQERASISAPSLTCSLG